MGMMSLNLATLNARRLRDPSNCACLLGELSNLSVNVAAVQVTHFTCAVDRRVLEDDYVVLSAYDNRSGVGVSFLIGHSLNSDVNFVLADDEDRLFVADVAVTSFELCAQYLSRECFFFRRLAPFLDDPKRIVLVGDWNAILDSKIDRVGRGARGSRRFESSLIDSMARHDLVDRFYLDHSGREKLTWLDSLRSVHARSYLDRVLVWRADTYFIMCPTFHYVAQTGPRLIRVNLCDRLVRPVFRDRLESLVQRTLVGTVTGNKWWGSLKYRIRDLAIKYGRQLNLERNMVAKSLEDKLYRAAEGGIH